MFGMEWFEVIVVTLVMAGVSFKNLIQMYTTAKKRRQMLSLPPSQQKQPLMLRN